MYRKARPNTEGSTLKDMFMHTGDEAYRTKFLESLDRLVELQVCTAVHRCG